VARPPRRPDRPRPAHAGLPDHRRRGRAGAGPGSAVARRARPAVYSPQTQESLGPCAGRAARGSLGRLRRHDLRRDRTAGGGQAEGVPAQVAATLPPPVFQHLRCQNLDRLRPAVAASLEEAGDRLFAFLRLPPRASLNFRKSSLFCSAEKRRFPAPAKFRAASRAATVKGGRRPPPT
jgi:hypothetical protein